MHDIKATGIWIILMGLSLLMFFLSVFGLEGQVFVVSLLLAAWFKGQMIIDHFMELKRVALIWRMIISIWLILVMSGIFILYLLSN